MSDLKEKAFYVWFEPKDIKKEPRKVCQGKSCPLYDDSWGTMHCGYFGGGWCSHLEYGQVYDKLLVKFEDVEELEQKVKNLETDRDNLLKSLHTCTQNLNSYAKESVELKQKLQQFKHSLEIQLDVLKSKPHHSETETQLEIILNEFEEKFEELLKGESWVSLKP
jgi:hypothetical protein